MKFDIAPGQVEWNVELGRDVVAGHPQLIWYILGDIFLISFPEKSKNSQGEYCGYIGGSTLKWMEDE